MGSISDFFHFILCTLHSIFISVHKIIEELSTDRIMQRQLACTSAHEVVFGIFPADISHKQSFSHKRGTAKFSVSSMDHIRKLFSLLS